MSAGPPSVIGNVTGHPHDYRLTVAPSLRSIFHLSPDTALIKTAPIGFQVHMPVAWALFALWPFTRLVHVFSAPLGYITRPYIVYRSRGARPGARPTRRGSEPSTAPTRRSTSRQH
jgi:nitrate reductase gamma subunit